MVGVHIAGDTPYDHSLVRQAATLVRQLPAIRASSFNKDFLMVHLGDARMYVNGHLPTTLLPSKRLW